MKRLAALVVAAAMLSSASVAAQEVLTIGVRSEASSLDPHWTQLSADLQVQEHIFEKLVNLDSASQPIPGLAVSWEAIDDTTWEFKLREGVTWHDGEPFTADDVIFSFDRLRGGIEGAPASPAFTLDKGGKTWEKVDDLTVRVRTDGPYPTVAEDLAMVPIVAEHVARGVTASVDFNSGDAAIGTGPFLYNEFRSGDRISVVKNPGWWGGEVQWDEVVFRPVTQDASRLAALLNGDVDMIDYPPTADLPSLRDNPDFTVSSIPSDRLIYVMPAYRDVEDYVLDNDGNVMQPNPLRDWRVRKALSLAINREAIRDRIMGGASLPTRNVVPPGFFGYDESLEADPYDPEAAQALLAEAGYGDGFQLTLHGPNDRYINDARIVEAIAQMWTRIGVKTAVDTMPRNIFFSDLIRGHEDSFPGHDVPKFSMSLTGWGTVAGEATYTVSGILETYNAATGGGNGNFGRYSNPRIDARSILAKRTIDRDERLRLLQEAINIGMEDYALIPLHFQVNHWAMRRGLEHAARTNERTLAIEVRRVD
ncbi:ABC transporter substrate-binding protein [Salinarimonas ramus]|uniref:ABC transporter substrate-binding protein n=1 Tax=Salinarimonas ramus TaxID=690164 RepID=A0A917QGW3_9HYPH|nr:ABC transporter substrate-binding protein [Salinarimonas ramus]GGK50688.1 ABC transporter substrate-binding protein [Salinarimonas ramus]